MIQLVKNPPTMQETSVPFLGQEDTLEKGQATCASIPGKESACNVGDLGSILGLERSPGEGKAYPLQYSALENSMDYTIHEVTKKSTLNIYQND